MYEMYDMLQQDRTNLTNRLRCKFKRILLKNVTLKEFPFNKFHRTGQKRIETY